MSEWGKKERITMKPILKRLFALTLALIMALALAACNPSNNNNDTGGNTNPPASSQQETSTPPSANTPEATTPTPEPTNTPDAQPEAPPSRAFSAFPTAATAETGNIPGTNIYVVKISGPYDVNVYFVDTGDGYIMIDSGYENTEALEAGMEELNINVEDVKWLLLTHTDFDHVGGLPLFPDADIYINENEIQHLDGTVGLRKSLSWSFGISIDMLIQLQDGQELLFGETIVKCFHAPGHTLGSMAYLVYGQYLFPGDAFFVFDRAVGTYPMFSENEALAQKTIEDLKEIINVSALVLTPHHGYYEGSKLIF
jgi:glyoxylase-like metal-dependent hydrolase (beta-lactamase superfamily II)